MLPCCRWDSNPRPLNYKSLPAKVKSSCQGFTLAGRTFSQGDEGSNLLPAKVSRENFSSYQGAKVLSAKVPGRFPWYQEWPTFDNSLQIEWCQRKRRRSTVKTGGKIPLAFSFRRNEMVRGGVLLFVARALIVVSPCVFFLEGRLLLYPAYFGSPQKAWGEPISPQCTIILLIKHWGEEGRGGRGGGNSH